MSSMIPFRGGSSNFEKVQGSKSDDKEIAIGHLQLILIKINTCITLCCLLFVSY